MKLTMRDLEALVERVVAERLPSLVAEQLGRASAALVESARPKPSLTPRQPAAKPASAKPAAGAFSDLLNETRQRMAAAGELDDATALNPPDFERLAFAKPISGRASTVPAPSER